MVDLKVLEQTLQICEFFTYLFIYSFIHCLLIANSKERQETIQWIQNTWREQGHKMQASSGVTTFL